MMKWKYIPDIHSDEIIETVDILPTSLKYSNHEILKDIDGKFT